MLLTTRNLFDLLLDDRISGIRAPALHRFLATEYRDEVMRAVQELLALSVLVGAAAGAAVATARCLREHISGTGAKSLGRRVAGTSIGVLTWFVWVYARDVATRPALHQAT
ncbi:MAG TPA: hypothetical protein VIV60_33140, partial [Polyangiaceae bacterium]